MDTAKHHQQPWAAQMRMQAAGDRLPTIYCLKMSDSDELYHAVLVMIGLQLQDQ